MKTRTFLLILSAFSILSLLGCTLSTTVMVEEDHDVRLVNRSGSQVKVRMDDGKYRYIDNGEVIIISVNEGYHELEWTEMSNSRSHTRPTKVYTFTIDFDLDIEFNDDPDIMIIER
ncbi:hypothetical protein GF312_19010 [Candidatus Poribacteria bacterium]|nr:hypothetical protein [Candidatus Poribacteria bacterium]